MDGETGVGEQLYLQVENDVFGDRSRDGEEGQSGEIFMWRNLIGTQIHWMKDEERESGCVRFLPWYSEHAGT